MIVTRLVDGISGCSAGTNFGGWPWKVSSWGPGILLHYHKYLERLGNITKQLRM